MATMTLSEIWIYPIKSLTGIRLSEGMALERGLQWDRRWMIVNGNGLFLSQRTLPTMALLQTTLEPGGIRISKPEAGSVLVPYQSSNGPTLPVTIWDDVVEARAVDQAIDLWLSEVLQQPVRLVQLTEDTARPVDARFAVNQENVSFADGFPFLLIGQDSLDALNKRLEHPLSMNRFRPNFVVKGFTPHQEDHLKEIRIGEGEVHFHIVKPCSRCVMTTIDPTTALKGSEPLKTLATYRKVGNKILFGQNMVCSQVGLVKEGDPITILA
ncbi:hypothetical protein CLV98_101706 [Dyadobacter jejuensis]|uniref:MOSC domain-containing protein n=1 Tax=Dyadobacter jejuensis TaxID=1082580 RepID=A0A316AST2_9BACT|nr:MOSC N-terminal beta barrel domain-containing protein [Dyadobacter jejuensis]PWJ60521.1 hypothetical protein CLV98_101706 [Dyadobacter jejuensis]